MQNNFKHVLKLAINKMCSQNFYLILLTHKFQYTVFVSIQFIAFQWV